MAEREEDILLGGRVISFRFGSKRDYTLFARLKHLLYRFEKKLTPFLDEYAIPPVVMVTLKQGDGSLEGMYHVEGKRVSESIIDFDLYTKPFFTTFKEESQKTIDYELLDTFVHELIHNRHKSEGVTQRLSRKFMKAIEHSL